MHLPDLSFHEEETLQSPGHAPLPSPGCGNTPWWEGTQKAHDVEASGSGGFPLIHNSAGAMAAPSALGS